MESISNLQKILDDLGIPQSEMANELGMSRQQLNNIINGRGKFTYEQLADLFNKYNVNLNFLITGKGDMFNSNSVSAHKTDRSFRFVDYTDDTDYTDDIINTVKLTQREKEVLELLIKGFSNNQIASQICITPHTVKAHITNIMKKTKINRRIKLVAKYVKSMQE